MVLKHQHVLLVRMRKFYRSAEPLLLPKYGYTAANSHMRHHVIVTDEYLFGLNVICHVEINVDSSATEPGARHVLASSAYHAIVKGKKFILAV